MVSTNFRKNDFLDLMAATVDRVSQMGALWIEMGIVFRCRRWILVQMDH
jgi:hypothetical protein